MTGFVSFNFYTMIMTVTKSKRRRVQNYDVKTVLHSCNIFSSAWKIYFHDILPVLVLVFVPQNFSNVIITQVCFPFRIIGWKRKYGFSNIKHSVFWCYFFMTALNSSPEMTPSPFLSKPARYFLKCISNSNFSATFCCQKGRKQSKTLRLLVVR